MKLDSIVYDYSNLQTAIADALNSESPKFKAIYPSDTATSLVNTLASYGSMLQYQLVSAMANMYADTAYSDAGIYQLAETLGNRLHGNISSQIYCNITRTNLKGINIVIPAGTKFTVEDLNFFNPETIVFPIASDTINRVKLVQGVKLVSEQIASGISGEKIYFCDDFKCNTNMVTVYVDKEEWDITDSFLPYVVTDTSVSNRSQAVILKTDPDGRTYIKFGNNTNGRIPEKGKPIRIEYVSNEGANGNLNNNNLKINLNTPIYYTNSANTRERLEVDITAISTASGGYNTQSIEVLRQSSPYVFGSGQRAVRRNDYKSMLLNQCGYLTTNVWGEYEEAAIQGGYNKIMMNMVYYTGIKSIQKYDLQPIRSLDIDIAEIAATQFAITVKNGASIDFDYTGWYLKKLPDDYVYNPKDPNPLDINNITENYADEDVWLFQTEAEARAVIENRKLYYPEVFKAGEDVASPMVLTWLDNPDNPKRDTSTVYPISGSIEGARGFLGSYVINISSYDINNNLISVKYRDKQGTGILTCDPSINNTFDNFEETVFPANDLIIDKNNQGVYNFTVSQNQADVSSGEDFTKIVVEDDQDYETSGSTKEGLVAQPFVITFDNPYQIRFEFDKETAVCAFAFKTPESDSKYKNFIHQFAIYGANFTGSVPDYSNVKNDSNWTKLSGMQTFDDEINPKQYSDWITTSVYDPESSTTTAEDVTSSRKVEESKITYTISKLAADIYTYVIKVNGLTIPNNKYTIIPDVVIDEETGEEISVKTILFTDAPGIGDDVVVEGTTFDWVPYRYYVIEVYTVHDASQQTPNKVSFRQIKALYKDSASTINYTRNNAINLNVPLRVEKGTTNRVICLPDSMQYYEYKVVLGDSVDEEHGYRTGDILKWTNIVDGINYIFTINIINLATKQCNITIQTDSSVPSSNLRGKSNLSVSNDTFDASSSTTRGVGGTISISSTSTVNIYGSYTGNFYTNSDIQSADLPVINKYNHFTTYIEFKQPHIKNVTIEANLEYENVTNYQVVRNNVIAAVNALFDLQPFSIGSPLNVSDIWKAINSVDGVKRFNVISPLNDIECLPYELLMLPAENLIINDIINSEYK